MLDFEKMPLFSTHSYRIFKLIPQWAFSLEVDSTDIIRQLYIAHTWCLANKDKAPKKNVARFLNQWMGKAKEFGNLKRIQKCSNY